MKHYKAEIGDTTVYVEAESASRAETLVIDWADHHGHTEEVENDSIDLEFVEPQEFYRHWHYQTKGVVTIRERWSTPPYFPNI